MARKTKDADKVVTVQAAVPVVIWKANRPLNEQQHEELARKLQSEQERSGLKVMLVPHSVDPIISADLEEQQSLPSEEDGKEANPEDPKEQKDKEEQPSTDGGNDE
ncbi:hypothetical protein J41TS12_17450 [Paenibacillus antibioticophila]|uniref:Uncharacterized protein n=1 Tax=Paenibacillus antibioticophila TaxID=1274374 RepID=A0A919XRZ1_9BACL|nr:hypothetical protein [Paenibacillus antibioticophila]GIO36884.1 hypothetical protein J41TS12_17450 [Paenibacillus antibioticophila]